MSHIIVLESSPIVPPRLDRKLWQIYLIYNLVVVVSHTKTYFAIGGAKMRQYECHPACASVHIADTPSRTPVDFGTIFDKKDIAKGSLLLNLTVHMLLVLSGNECIAFYCGLMRPLPLCNSGLKAIEFSTPSIYASSQKLFAVSKILAALNHICTNPDHHNAGLYPTSSFLASFMTSSTQPEKFRGGRREGFFACDIVQGSIR